MKKINALPPICISVTGESPEALIRSAQRALQYSRFLELRLDWLPKPALALPLLPRLLQSAAGRWTQSSVTLQATCRRASNGGRFESSVAAQMRVLQQASAAGCRVLDLEIESAEAAGADAVDSLRTRALLILSWHDFQRTPRLEAVARRLRRFPADFYKLVPTATRQSDNCAALDFLRSAAEMAPRKQWIVFCMGQAGIPSRVLTLSRGGAFVYASCPPVREDLGRKVPAARLSITARTTDPRVEATTVAGIAAPGQIAYETLRDIYRAEKLMPQTSLYGLLGSPIGHSIGAALHNAAFRARNLDAVYMPLLSSDLKDFRKAARLFPLAGFSVTIPHKQNILALLDRADRTVQLAGAANTVRVRRGQWEAINTDVEGVVVPLRSRFGLAESKSLDRSFRVVVVGTGGAARAALAALRVLRCREVWITGRTPAKARALAKEFGGKALALADLPREHFDLMIHATSVGMWPRSDECLLVPEQINAGTVFDLVYNPAETRLLQLARERGCQTISGLEMFLAQAARQFEFWTGKEAPRPLMRKIAQRELDRFVHS